MGTYRIMYDRSFYAWPEFAYQGKIVTGASVGILFRFYKNGEEVLFDSGADCEVCHHVICSFNKDAENCCELRLVPYLVEDWFDRMEYEIADWELTVYAGTVRELFEGDFSDEEGDCPVCEGLSVSQEDFVRILREHWKNFDSIDNIDAECLSVGYVEAKRRFARNGE